MPTESIEIRSTIIDRVVEYFSPGAAAGRYRARAALSAARVGASYRGGIVTRTSVPWSQSRSIRNQSAGQRFGLGTMRDRARRVWDENPIGRSLLKTEVDNVVASGFNLQVRTSSPEFNREAEDRWEQWLEVADLRGMLTASDLQRQMYQNGRRDGDRGIVLVDRGGESRLQLIPGDLIQTPHSKYGDTSIVDGVEVDGASRPIAFHVLDEDENGKQAWTRIPVANFIFTSHISEDVQIRGETCYAQIFSMLDNLEQYIDGVSLAAWMGTVFGIVFKESNGAKQLERAPLLTDSQGSKRRAITLENGLVKYVGNEDEVVQVDAKQPMSQTPDFIRAMLRLIGLPFDMPLELAMKDMSTVNFSSARIGLLGYYRACRARQRSFRTKVMDRIYQWWISREVKRGSFITSAPDRFWTHSFMAEGWDYTDPVSEAQADQLQIDMGIKTPQMVASERGRDWEEMQIDLKAAAAFRKLQQIGDVRSTYTRDVEPVAVQAPEGPATDPSAEVAAKDLEFKRGVTMAFLADKTVNDIIYNVTDMPKLLKDVGLPTDPKLDLAKGEALPFMPVITDTGDLVSGDVIYDPQGDLVGGDVENDKSADLSKPSSSQPAEPPQEAGQGQDEEDGEEDPPEDPADPSQQ